MSPGPPTIIHSVPQDVDAYNISLFPQDLLKLYHPELTLQLISHAPTPSSRTTPTSRTGHLVIKPSTFPLALIKGKQTIAVGQLMDYLSQIGCNTIRLQVYGQKQHLLTLKSNIGNLNHPLAHLNTFDLGTMYDDPRITLVQPVQYSNPKMTLYPMLLPIAMGYGSVHMDIALGKGEMYQVKAYPRLVHCIKAESGNQALWAPDTVRRARVRCHGPGCSRSRRVMSSYGRSTGIEDLVDTSREHGRSAVSMETMDSYGPTCKGGPSTATRRTKLKEQAQPRGGPSSRSRHSHEEDQAQGACRWLPLRGSRDKSQRNCH
ncbi:hypothetical protein NDA14_001000 [Ustilago hordei]|nr:hypothetical protein NDA14_001000 [Ustilago hordei]